jgi:Fe-S oxidoreductase
MQTLDMSNFAGYRHQSNIEKYFKDEFGPETGHDYVYFFDVLLDWLESGRIKVDQSVHEGRIVTWHDSCKHMRSAYLTFGDESNLEKPRKILSYLIDMDNFREMPHNRLESYCCGAGSGNWPRGPSRRKKPSTAALKPAISWLPARIWWWPAAPIAGIRL